MHERIISREFNRKKKVVYDTHFRKDIDDNKFSDPSSTSSTSITQKNIPHNFLSDLFRSLITVFLSYTNTHNLCHAIVLLCVDSASFPSDLSSLEQSKALARKTLRFHYYTPHQPLNQYLMNEEFFHVP